MQGLAQVSVAVPDPPVRSGSRAAGGGISRTEFHSEVITDFSRLELIAADWDRLWQTDDRAEIFQTFGWAKAWWRVYGQQFNLCSLLVFDADHLVGIVPLVKRNNVIQFLGTPQADYADIVCEESRTADVLAVAIEALLSKGEDWSECAFQHLAKHSRMVRHCEALPRKLRRRIRVVPADSYQTIVLRENREQALQSFLGKNHTKRRQNKLQKAGRVQFRYMETRAEAQEYLNDFFRQHVRRRAVIGKESACSIPEFRNFLRALVDEIEPTDRLRFGALELDGRALAWGLGFQVNGKFLLYQHTFDVDAWDYSPGEVLLWNLLEYAKGNVTREFDFGKGDEAYKDRFTNYARKTFYVFVERPGLVGEMRGLFRKVQSYVRLAAGNLKRTGQQYRPALRVFRSLQAWIAERLRVARYARKNGALLKFVMDRSAQLFLNTVRSKGSLQVFASAGIAEANAECSDTAACDQLISVKAGSLGDLVDVALERPQFFGMNQLPRCRQRLKRGDRPYIVREKSEAVLVSWMVSTAQTDNAFCSQDRAAASYVKAMLIDDCEPVAEVVSPASYRKLLSFLTLEAAAGKAQLFIQCRADQSMLRSELQHQGFQPGCQTARYKGVA